MKNNKIFIMNRQQGKSTLAKLIAELNYEDSLIVFNNTIYVHRDEVIKMKLVTIDSLKNCLGVKYKTLIIDDYDFSAKSTQLITEFIQDNFELENIFIFCTLPKKYESIPKEKLSDILNYFKLIDNDISLRVRNTIKGTSVKYEVFDVLYDSFLTCGNTFDILDMRLTIPPTDYAIVDNIISVLKADEYVLFNYTDIMPIIQNVDSYVDGISNKKLQKLSYNEWLSPSVDYNKPKNLEKYVVNFIRSKNGKLIEASYNVTKNIINIEYYGVEEKPMFMTGEFTSNPHFLGGCSK
jgi:hypothetical protein